MTLQFVANVEPADTAVTDVPACRPSQCQRGSRTVPLRPRHGEGMRQVELHYLWTGAVGAPTVVVQGGISADREICAAGERAAPGWWQDVVGNGRAIDLERFRVLSIDWLSGDDLGVEAISSEDQADALVALADQLGIEHFHAFVGASYGAMVGLAFAARHGERLGRLVALAGAHRPHPLATAQRSIQRGILRLGLETGRTDEAVSLARQLAMTTYRGAEEFGQRFRGEAEVVDGRLQLPVEAWLEHAGRRFVARFDARRYLSLSESIDLHAVDPRQVRVPVSLIGFASDRLVPLSELCALQRELGAGASLDVIDTPYGHDGFLKETTRLAPLLRDALNERGA